ncbi:MAG: SpoIIE family protein phosphatase [Thermoanaerobaculales bacterium]|nr:SpoIIE family protein phosphatase [Thermoanaerobaculales bacterium]
MLDLQVTTADGSEWEQRITDDDVVIGRSTRAGLTIPDRALSRLHARLYRSGESWFAEDLDSRNGTFVNERRLGGPVRVVHGDILTLGGSRIVMGGSAQARKADDGSWDLLAGHTVFRSADDLLASGSGSVLVDEVGTERSGNAALGRLNLLNEVHRALSRSVDLQELLNLILDRVFDHLGPEDGAIYLVSDGGYQRAASRSTRDESDRLGSQSLLKEVVEGRQAALVLDAQSDERFNQAQSLMISGLRSILAAPLLDGDDALGMIVLGSSHSVRSFDEADMELLVTLASVAAMRISNVRLAEEAAERQRMEQELTLGRRIQTALLPENLPEVEGWEIHAGNLPSRGVSGDYYSIFLRNDGETLIIVVADVSGKGIAAALLTASLEALSAAPLEAGSPLDLTCHQVSKLLYDRTPPEKFATAFFAEVELSTGLVRYVNAGHNPGLVLRVTGSFEWLNASGVPLGLLPVADYELGEVRLNSRDVLVLYTDGLTEAANPETEEYGEDRLRQAGLVNRLESLGDLARKIESDLDTFVQGVPYGDDRTLVLLRWTGNGERS